MEAIHIAANIFIILVPLTLLLSRTLLSSFLTSYIFRCFSGRMHIVLGTAAAAAHFPLEKELDNMQKSIQSVCPLITCQPWPSSEKCWMKYTNCFNSGQVE